MSVKNVSPVAAALATIAAGKDKVVKGKLALTAACIPLVKEGNLYSAIAGEGDNAIAFTFKLAEYSRPTFHNGEPVKGAQGAKFAAFCEAHGAEPSAALQSDFVKCLDAAIAIALGTSGADLKGGKFVLPLSMCKRIDLGTADKPSAGAKELGKNINFGRKAKLAGEALHAAIAKETVECDGGNFAGGKVPTTDQAIAALQVYAQQAGLIPPKPKRDNNKTVTADKVRDAMSVINKAFVMIEKSDESPIAFTARDETALREMAQHIAAYFAV